MGDSPASDSTANKQKRFLPEVAFGLSILRGVVAIGVGLLLFFIPEKTGPMVGNFMGVFWLTSGIALLRRNRHDPLLQAMGSRTAKIIAVVAILAGLAVVTRGLSEQVVPRGTLISLLGIVMLVTGFLHLVSVVRVGGLFQHIDRLLGALMGIFELILGLALVVSPLDRNPVMYGMATIWSLAFGVLVLARAFTQWSQARKASKEVAPDVSTSPT